MKRDMFDVELLSNKFHRIFVMIRSTMLHEMIFSTMHILAFVYLVWSYFDDGCRCRRNVKDDRLMKRLLPRFSSTTSTSSSSLSRAIETHTETTFIRYFFF
jgi:hypothetical protein